MVKIKEELVVNDNSKGFIQDYLVSSPGRFGVFNGYSPNMNTALIKSIVEEDPIVKAAILTLVDKTLESKYIVLGKDKKSSIQSLQDELGELRFNKLLRKILFNLFLYNNAFVEIRKVNGKVTDLNLLETEFMRINAETNGDIISYYQEQFKDSNKRPEWKPEEVVHFKLDDYSTNVWSPATFKTLKDTVLIKDAIRKWMHWFFNTNQLRPIISVEKANLATVKEFVEHLKAAEKDPTKPLPAMGKVTVDKLQRFADEGTSILALLSWLDKQILSLLQVPPIALGHTDSSGRSTGVEEEGWATTRVKSVQLMLEDTITYDLFPKMGYEKARLQFGLLGLTETRKVLETVQIMKTSLFTDEAIEEFLINMGLRFNTKKILKDEAEIAMMSNKDLGTGNESMKGNSNSDSMKSRQRQDKGTIQKANQSEIVKNSYGKYPYTYEVKLDDSE